MAEDHEHQLTDQTDRQDISVFRMDMVLGPLGGAHKLDCRNHSIMTARGERGAEFTVSTPADVQLSNEMIGE